MRHAECICTGCDFFSPVEGRFVHGDLHQLNDTYIFSACMDESRVNCAWEYQRQPGKLVISCTDNSYFERRGVIVFSRTSAEMNVRLAEYVKPQLIRMGLYGRG